MLSFFPRGVLDEILNLIESVSEGFPSYSYFDFRKYDICLDADFIIESIWIVYLLLDDKITPRCL